MKTTQLLRALCACLAFALSSSASAALLPALNGLGVYDTDLDITYLYDPNYIQTSNNDTDGLVTFSAAASFIGTLNSSFYLGFNNWRMPTTLVPDSNCTTDTAGTMPSADSTGYYCHGSELGHLFYTELVGIAGSSMDDAFYQQNYGIFATIPDGVFWTSTENPDNSTEVFTFTTTLGYQNITFKNFLSGRIWVVRDGGADTVDPVPLPGTAWLFTSGLLGLIGTGRRKRET